MAKTPFVIRNDAELVIAIERAQELTGCTCGSEEERELEAIVDAIDVYAAIARRLMRQRPQNDNGDFFR